jgi:hypothetical protein
VFLPDVPAAPSARIVPRILALPYTAKITALFPVSVSVLAPLMVRLEKTRMSTLGPPVCATLDAMVGDVCPEHQPVNACWLESYVVLQSIVLA